LERGFGLKCYGWDGWKKPREIIKEDSEKKTKLKAQPFNHYQADHYYESLYIIMFSGSYSLCSIQFQKLEGNVAQAKSFPSLKFFSPFELNTVRSRNIHHLPFRSTQYTLIHIGHLMKVNS